MDFTSERKTMSTVVSGLNGNPNTLLLKGAPERVIEKCLTYIVANGSIKPFLGDQKEKLIK